MNCQRCHGCMARDHFLDLQESGGEWWASGWRCINCGNVYDPVAEQNRRRHAAALASAASITPLLEKQLTLSIEEESFDIAA